ncbi:serine/threonine-protein kinase [Chloropicon primus]|uniref:Serine/threonine-protein kinase n=1 Tax=Chloropicon primus TaxID=1764295 RepID=A0A5B8MVY6_9CHLO|nr:serine/threonine-protein kinase [Chloropicon primus]UPR03037.1 serine/threonine-protein kinase [Chloropicon primus]|mmetsp:Transcript_1290/g.3743  ORF Transcript_1290/g.3743 Transcript_1290/m.3743 type:complete len:481 (-) Transcript_1290:884-2326(-)|eukprot:QDZ23824.1 serine/threonine-protein kinase [Chloropicon primus]
MKKRHEREDEGTTGRGEGRNPPRKRTRREEVYSGGSRVRTGERARDGDRSKGRGKRSRPGAGQAKPFESRRRSSLREREVSAERREVKVKTSDLRELAPEPASTSYSSHRCLRKKVSPPHRADDENGHYKYELGENFTKRYKILSHLGKGTFGKVVECWDRLKEEYVAIKVIRNVPKYRGAGMIELAVLNTVRKQKGNFKGGSHCVQFEEWFDYRGHICIVFAKLGMSLFDLLRKNRYKPFDLYHVQAFARQMLETVEFLHTISLVHTDLKPENILLPNHKYRKVPPSSGSRRGTRIPEKAHLYLIDFGSATFDDQYHSKVVSTRHYRAPEVMLGLGWSFPCDIWSLGCIIVELVTGEALFKTHDNLEHLAMMQKVLGVIPGNMVTSMFSSTSEAKKYFHEKDGTLAWPERCALRDSEQAVNELKDLKGLISEKCDVSIAPHVDGLVDLLKGLLLFDPRARLSAKGALKHDFFQVETKPT